MSWRRGWRNVIDKAVKSTHFDAMFTECWSDAFGHRHDRSAVLDVEWRQFTRRQVFTTRVARGRQLNNKLQQKLSEWWLYIYACTYSRKSSWRNYFVAIPVQYRVQQDCHTAPGRDATRQDVEFQWYRRTLYTSTTRLDDAYSVGRVHNPYNLHQFIIHPLTSM